MLVAFGATSAANYAFSLLMARLLLPGDFGVLAFAQTLLFISGLLLETGVPWSLSKELARVPDAPSRSALIRGALLTNLLLALALGALVLLLFTLGPLRTGLESWGVALAVALALPAIASVGAARGVAQGLEAFPTLATLQVSEVLGKAASSTLLVMAGWGVVGAVGGFVLGAFLAATLGLVAVARQPEMHFFGPAARSGLRVVGPMFGAFLGSALLLNLDFVALKLFAPEARAAAGFYQAGIVLANAPYFLVASVVVPLAFARLARLGTLPGTAQVVAQALKLTALFVLPVELLLMAAPEGVLSLLFPSAYEAGAPALRFRALGVSFLALAAVVASAYQAVGQASRVALVFLSASLVEGLVLWALAGSARAFSAVTVAVSFAGITLAALLLLGAAYLRQLPVGQRRAAAGWSLRYAAALSLSALAFWVGSSAFGLAPALAAGGLVYGALVLILRLWTPRGRPSFLDAGATPAARS